VTVLGEEPVTRITRTQYTYSTPDEHAPSAVQYDNDLTGTSSRPSTGKTPSPERGYPVDDVKLSKILTSSVTSSNSFRRSEISDGARKYVGDTAAHDVSRRPKATEGDEKFVSSATAFLSQRQKVTDESSGTRTSPERGHTERKCTSSATTRTRQTSPSAVRADSEDKKNYGKYSSRSEYTLNSERSRGRGECRRSLQSDFDDETDGYRYSSRTATESSSRRCVACLSSLS
jgi:hypothetical protein